MSKKMSLAEAAKSILLGEDSKEIQAAAISAGKSKAEPTKKLPGDAPLVVDDQLEPQSDSGKPKNQTSTNARPGKAGTKGGTPAPAASDEPSKKLSEDEFQVGDLVEDEEGNVGQVVNVTEDEIQVDWTPLSEETDDEKKDEKADKDDDEDDSSEKDDDDSDKKEDDDKDDKKPTMKEAYDAISFDSLHEDVAAMFEGSKLSDSFRNKATTIFEAAVRSRVQEYAEALDAVMEAQIEEVAEEILETVTEATNEYMDNAISEWISENEIAIESNLRTELTEDFINGLRNLFIENYIDVPEEKLDVLEDLALKVEELESDLNEEIEKNIKTSKALKEARKTGILLSMTEGLVETQKAKIYSLAENVEFKDEETFEEAVSTLRESYFPEKGTRPTRGSDELDEVSEVVDQYGKKQIVMVEEVSNDPMDQYVKTIKRTII